MSFRDLAFIQLCREARLPAPVQEYRICQARKFRWDFAWPDYKLALEVQGAVFAVRGSKRCPACGQQRRGGHSSGTGILRDMEKDNVAAQSGWRVLKFMPQELLKTSTIELVRTSLLVGLVGCWQQKPEISLNASKALLSQSSQTKTNNQSKR